MTIDHKAQRSSDVEKITTSTHRRKVVVAGPGTGKSYLFTELIKRKRAAGKTDFLAITFIGKLGDALADDLCGLANTATMHGFARGFVLQHAKDWVYYPRIDEIIAEDLKAEGITSFAIGDENYIKKTKYYKAVGDADVVHYAVQICRKDRSKIPARDLILVDEYQDFNSIESEFVDLLAEANEIVIVGDDDQALYAFKGSSADFIRSKYSAGNGHFESHTLRYCSRCTEPVIGYFHDLIRAHNLNDPTKKRIQKEYICYTPDKAADSSANPKIHLIEQCPVGMIAHKVKSELESFVENQKLKDVLVIGEGRSCETLLKGVAQQLKGYGFTNVDYRSHGQPIPIQQPVLDAYKFLSGDPNSVLAWRILGNPADEDQRKRHLKNVNTFKKLSQGTRTDRDSVKQDDVIALEEVLEDWHPAQKETSDDLSVRENQNEMIRRTLLVDRLKRSSNFLRRPLSGLEITICNILNSKGLGADVVFLIGFDQGRFPSKAIPTDSEVYQMLVAVTRAKKRVYLINTVGKSVSAFASCLRDECVERQRIKPRR